MTKYSHTRLASFENCPLQYRFTYIDNIKSPFQQTDSTFLGSRCHEALERLYKDKIGGKIDTKDEFIGYFEQSWKEGYGDEILHTDEHLSSDCYRRLGIGWLERYYDEFFLDDQMQILGIETDDTLILPDGNQYYIRIDKLGYLDGVYYVCDYKTDSKIKTQSAADADRQLAMYALWVKKTFPDAKKVKLLWQMLRFSGPDAQVISERTMDQLDELEKDVVDLISEIENTAEFRPADDAYCDYCVYKGMCPKFTPPRVLTMDDATALVDEFAANKEKINELKERNEQIEADLSVIVSENPCDIISATNKDLAVKKIRSVDYKDEKALLPLIKRKGLYERYLAFNKRTVTDDILAGTADPDIVAITTVYEKYSFSLKNKKELKEK